MERQKIPQIHSYRSSLIFLLAVLLILQSIVIIVAGLDSDPWGDGARLVETVRQFGADMSIKTLTQYDQLSTPLPFIAYGLWGRVFGFELPRLRLLSILIAILSYLCFHHLVFKLTGRAGAALWSTLFLAVNPYMLGFSVFVFTDGLAILMVLLSVYGVVRSNAVLLAVALAGAILCRQYAMFLVVAGATFYCIGWLRLKTAGPGKMLLSVFLSLLPFAALICLWGGLSPINKWREFYLTGELGFDPTFFSLYVSQLFWYLLPIVLLRFRELYVSAKTLMVCLALSWLYLLAPVAPSIYSVDIEVLTVGLFHRFLMAIHPSPVFSQVVFFAGFMLALPILAFILKDAYVKIRAGVSSLELFLNLSILSFLVVMPFSYHGWEKYFTLLLPIAIVRLLLIKSVEPESG